MSPQDNQQVRWLSPFVQNHQVSAEVLNAAQSDPKSLADRVALAITRNNITVKGAQLKTALEVNLQRRAVLRTWYSANDQIRDLNPQATFNFCERGLEIWDSTETVRIAWMDRKVGEVRRSSTGPRTLGINTPVNLDNPENEAKKQEDVAAEDEEDDKMKSENEQAPAQKHTIDEVKQENDPAAANAAKKPKTTGARTLGRTATL